MRKAAGIILITLGVVFLCLLIYILFVFSIMFGFSMFLFVDDFGVVLFVLLLGLVVAPAFYISGGIFCLRRKYWRVCLASASFAVFYLAFFSVFSLVSSPFVWRPSWSDCIYAGWPILVVLVAEVISVIFIVRKKKEWEEISDSVDGKVYYGG